MKSERFTRVKSVAASSALALVVGALVFGLSSLVVGPRSASPEHVGFDLTSGSSSFTITGSIYPSPACSGARATLAPGVADCAVFSVQNLLDVPITVQSITTSLDTSFPAPPAQCAPPTSFTLPSFSGTIAVGANATVSLPGVPIELKDSDTDQSACEDFTYHFTYAGGAQYTDASSIVLTSSTAAPASGQPMTLSAAVTGSNPSADASLPVGTVTFDSCPTAACASTTPLGTGTVGNAGVATLTTTGLTTGTHYLQAVYGGSGSDYTGSTSAVLTVTSGAPVTSAGTTGSESASTATKTTPSTVAFTGADIAGMAGVALLLIGAGTLVVVAVRRRRRMGDS